MVSARRAALLPARTWLTVVPSCCNLISVAIIHVAGGLEALASCGSRLAAGSAATGAWLSLLAQQGRLPAVLAAAAAVAGLQLAVPPLIR